MPDLPRPRIRFYNGTVCLLDADALLMPPPAMGQTWEFVDATTGKTTTYEIDNVTIRLPYHIQQPETIPPQWQALAGWSIAVQLMPTAW